MSTLLPEITSEILAALYKDGVKKVYIFDWDGVYNAFNHNTLSPKTCFQPDKLEHHPNPNYDKSVASKQNRIFREPKTFPFRWSTELIENMNTLTNEPDAVTLWLTTWREHMGGVLERVPLTSSRQQYYIAWNMDDTYIGHANKLHYGYNLLKNADTPKDTKIVWVDDEAVAKAYLSGVINPLQILLPKENYLYVKPSGRTAINLEDFDDIKTFMRNSD